MDYYLRVLPEKYFTTENLSNVETRVGLNEIRPLKAFAITRSLGLETNRFYLLKHISFRVPFAWNSDAICIIGYNIMCFQHDVVIETYCSPGGEFGVLMKRQGTSVPIVATVFRNDRYMEQHNAELAASIQNNNFRPPTSTFLRELLSRISGGADPRDFLRVVHIQN